MKRIVCPIAVAMVALAPSVRSQNQFELPTRNINPLNDSRPFGGPRMRYQQWYSAAEWRATAREPKRIYGLQFKAGTPAGQAGARIQLEVTMANSFATQATASFESNIVSGRTVVFPLQYIQLPGAIPGTWPVQLVFQNEFIWDGVSGVVVDIRLRDSGNGNMALAYDLEKAISTPSAIARMYTVNDPDSAGALVFRAGEGLTTRFLHREAITYPYGSGCPGEGGIVPEYTTSGGWPIPGNSGWRHELRFAPTQRSAIFLIGGSNTSWGGSVPLPHELVEIGGIGCFLRADPAAYASVMTVGNGPGTGSVSFNLPVPPVTSFVGDYFYSHWLILDPNAPNGVLAGTGALTHRVGRN